MRSLTLPLLLTGTFALAAACADDRAPGALSPCDTPAGPLLSCPPNQVAEPPPAIEDACWRLVECGLFAVENLDDQGNHQGDWVTCVNDLRGDDFTAARLDHVLRCVDASTCQDLAQGHCGDFGGEPQ